MKHTHVADPAARSNTGAPFVDATADRTAVEATADILHLAELVPVVRARLALDTVFPDDAVLASLRTIVARSSARERWGAAFDSNLGHWLALEGSDLNTALNTLIALLPAPRS